MAFEHPHALAVTVVFGVVISAVSGNQRHALQLTPCIPLHGLSRLQVLLVAVAVEQCVEVRLRIIRFPAHAAIAD
ncbi:hypothetical protein PS619_05310 [Pseudomonas fluorescens]|nr:hypothetical protein PS619_05310 [Pseudomonas fluorescens]VVN45563.1 hypothetical protein PS681_05751 [Pseudomonas fluorescens]VVN74833.1 hypothetical protein PS684_06023 [Pseudomonas fluorescens]